MNKTIAGIFIAVVFVAASPAVYAADPHPVAQPFGSAFDVGEHRITSIENHLRSPSTIWFWGPSTSWINSVTTVDSGGRTTMFGDLHKITPRFSSACSAPTTTP